jgi:regulator of replication initiation timing
MVSEIERLIIKVEAFEKANKNLQEKVKILESENSRLKEENQQLVELINQMAEENKNLEKENLRLQKELRKYHNENTPSGALPWYLKSAAIEMEEKKGEKKKPEGKSMNIRNSRPRRCDRTEVLQLSSCPCCGGKLKKRRAKPRKRIVLKLMLPEAEAVRYIIPKYWCENCKKEFSPKVPDALPNSKFDLNVFLFISFLSVGLNLSVDNISNLFSTVFGLSISPASVSNSLKKLKDYLGDKYIELEHEIRKESVHYRDETGWKRDGKINWAWVIATAKRILYKIEESRSHKTAKKFKPLRESITICDGYAAYNDLGGRIQRCWAHLLRKARYPEYPFSSDKEIEEYTQLVRGLQKLFKDAKEEKKLGCSPELKEKYEKRLFELLQMKGLMGRNREELTNYIMKFNDEWFTFLEFPKVEPTNNLAERALRHIVLKRKISQQSRSWESQQSYAMQASLYMTSKLRNQNYLEVLRNVVEEKINGVGKI